MTGSLKLSRLGDKDFIRSLERKPSVVIWDLDGFFTNTEVIEAGRLRAWLTNQNRSEQRMAVAKSGDKYSHKLLSLQHLKVGWVNCRLKQTVIVPRCFLECGHSSRDRRVSDRSRNYLKCSCKNHKVKECTSYLSCFPCKDTGVSGYARGHLLGSGHIQSLQMHLNRQNLRPRDIIRTHQCTIWR